MAVQTMINLAGSQDVANSGWEDIIKNQNEQIAQLKRELTKRQEIIGALQRAQSDLDLNNAAIPEGLILTRTELKLFLALKEQNICSFPVFQRALYEEGKALTSYETICVFLSHLRKKLKPKGFTIKARMGVGWYLEALEPEAQEKAA